MKEEDEVQRTIDNLKRFVGEGYGAQAELARKLGVPRQRLNDWLSGHREPDLRSWLKIQAFLKRERKKKAK